MPVPLATQRVVAFVWDFDGTLVAGHVVDPVLAAYGVDPEVFWAEVEGLPAYYARRGISVAPEVAYLGHLLTYVREGILPNLTNARLEELGGRLEPIVGLPEVMAAARARVQEIPEFVREGLTVEHHVVSTGLRPVIAGSPLGSHLDAIWASTLIETPAPPGYLERLPVVEGPAAVSRIGTAVDAGAKARALFAIAKGAGDLRDAVVDRRLPPEEWRVPFSHMIYVGDGPSDVPCFSILNTAGGKTLGVYATDDGPQRRVEQLRSEGRVQAAAPADYRPGSPAHEWLLDALEQIGYGIVEARRQAALDLPEPPPA